MKELSMQLVIPEPQRYYCEADERHFFAWLQAISAVTKVVGTPDGLQLDIETPVDRASFYELIGLLTRYQLNGSSLRPLCEGNPDPWFADSRNYWYDAVFGN